MYANKRIYQEYNIDKMFCDEDREPNWYYGIYKINMLVAGGSGSGKTWKILTDLLNNVFFENDDNVLCFLFLPSETYESGSWNNFLRKSNEIFPNVKFIIFDISRNKEFKDFNISKLLFQNVPIVNGFPELDQIRDLKNQIETQTKSKNKSMKNFKTLCIFDDFVSNFTKSDWLKYYRYLHNISRISGNTISCIQTLKNFPPSERTSYTVLCLFGNYLPTTNLKTLIENFIPLAITKEQVKRLMNLSRQDTPELKHKPLIIIGSTAPHGRNIMFNNKYVVFYENQ